MSPARDGLGYRAPGETLHEAGADDAMRVVAGSARGLRLVTPPGDAVRPTTDRVREALFNSLASLDVLRDAVVIDLFAGSGALGVEALSRGAGYVTFVDASADALRAVRTNLESTRLDPDAAVVRSDALEFLRRSSGTRYDLALVDPPYAFDGWPDLLAALDADLVVIESDREIDPGDDATVLRVRRYGSTVVTIARYGDPDPGRHTPEDRS